VGFPPIVELGDGAGVQLVDHGLDVRARIQWPQERSETPELPEVGAQGLVGARVLHLDGHLPAVRPARAVDLADRGGGGGLPVEVLEPLAPPQTELRVEDPLHLVRGERWRLGLEFGERLAERFGVPVRHPGLEHTQRLADLHGAALELTENGEDLLGGVIAHLLGDLAVATPQCASSRAADRAACYPQRQAGEPGGSPGRGTGYVGHAPIMAEDRTASLRRRYNARRPASPVVSTVLPRD